MKKGQYLIIFVCLPVLKVLRKCIARSSDLGLRCIHRTQHASHDENKCARIHFAALNFFEIDQIYTLLHRSKLNLFVTQRRQSSRQNVDFGLKNTSIKRRNFTEPTPSQQTPQPQPEATDFDEWFDDPMPQYRVEAALTRS